MNKTKGNKEIMHGKKMARYDINFFRDRSMSLDLYYMLSNTQWTNGFHCEYCLPLYQYFIDLLLKDHFFSPIALSLSSPLFLLLSFPPSPLFFASTPQIFSVLFSLSIIPFVVFRLEFTLVLFFHAFHLSFLDLFACLFF